MRYSTERTCTAASRAFATLRRERTPTARLFGAAGCGFRARAAAAETFVADRPRAATRWERHMHDVSSDHSVASPRRSRALRAVQIEPQKDKLMPEKTTLDAAKQDLREGKSATTAAGEFVHEEIEHIRRGKHGARSTKQAIAIGLSKARRAGVPLKPPNKGQATQRTRRSAERAYAVGQRKTKAPAHSRARAKATTRALKREPKSVVSKQALSRQAKSASARRRRAGSTSRRAKAHEEP